MRKNMILKTMAAVMMVVFVVSGSALDSKTWIPMALCMGSLAWLTLFAYANNFFRGSKERK